jgi:hypothetical protein
MKRNKKQKYIYLVHCNKEPLVYAVYESKQMAVRYAIALIRFRKKHIEERRRVFGFYHFHPFVHSGILKRMNEEESFEYFQDATVFSACISDKELNGQRTALEFGYDSCIVRVERRRLITKK